MKAGWQVKTLGEVIQLPYGKPLDPNDRNPNGLYPAYGANGEKDRTDKFYRDSPSIIVGRKGSAGEITLTEDRFWPLDVTYFVEFDHRQYDLQFLYYLLVTLNLPSMAKGVKPGINRSEVYALPVMVPPLPEQQRIVSLLDEAFDGIATTKAHAEKNLQNARAIFESHLQAVFTQRGEGWDERTLGEIYDVRDGTHDSPKYHDKGFPLVTSKNLKRDGLSFDDVRLIDASDYRKINERSAVHKGDVLLAMIGTIGNPVVVEMEPDFAIKNVALLKVPVEQNSHFLRYYLSSQFVVNKMQSEAKGTTQKFVGLGYLRSFSIIVPSGAKQAAIVYALDDLSTETNRLEEIYKQKSIALDELKKSLLHRAFSGQL